MLAALPGPVARIERTDARALTQWMLGAVLLAALRVVGRDVLAVFSRQRRPASLLRFRQCDPRPSLIRARTLDSTEPIIRPS